jgi:hypothetical protein
MLYYPQLASGSACQLPVSRTTMTRTLSNQLHGGDSIRMNDIAAGIVRWRLQYKNLADTEWSSIQELFEAVEGRLNSFTFLDPTDNLLTWSQDWSKPVWSVDPLLQIASGGTEPFGGTAAIQVTNTGQAAQSVFQEILAASSFQYCYSIYLRADSPGTVQLLVASTSDELRTAVAVDSVWKRCSASIRLSATEDGIKFGLELPAGARVFAFGAQVEAQFAAGEYKITKDRGGVYPKTRFDSDSFQTIAQSTRQTSCVVNLVSSLI